MVLDTNVVVSALVFAHGSLVWIRRQWREERFRPVVSRETTAELIRVLAYPKFRLDAEQQRELLGDYLPWCETHEVSWPPPPVPECRDPADRPFLELALDAQADALVTGDPDLHALRDRFAVPVLSPAEFAAS